MEMKNGSFWKEIKIAKDGKEVNLIIFVKNYENINTDSYIEISVDNKVVYSNTDLWSTEDNFYETWRPIKGMVKRKFYT